MNKSTLASFLIAIAAFIAISFLWPAYGDLRDNQTTRDNTQTELDTKQAGKQRLTALVSEYESNRSQVDRLGIFLPEPQRIEYTITSLSTAAETSGMRLTSLELGEPGTGNATQYDTIEIALELEGDFNGLLSFLRKLETSLRLYDVMAMEITPESDDSTQLTTTMSIRTYIVKDLTKTDTTNR